MVANNNTDEMCLDGIVRNLHYSIPHKPWEDIKDNDGNGMTTKFCSECYEIFDKIGKLSKPVEFVEESRYKQLIEIERKYNDILYK